MCLRRTPTALGSDVVCSTNWTGLSLNRQRRAARVDRALQWHSPSGEYRCYHQFDGDGVGASRRGARPGLRFFVLGEFLYWEFFYTGNVV